MENKANEIFSYYPYLIWYFNTLINFIHNLCNSNILLWNDHSMSVTGMTSLRKDTHYNLQGYWYAQSIFPLSQYNVNTAKSIPMELFNGYIDFHIEFSVHL